MTVLIVTRGLPGSGKSAWAHHRMELAPAYGDTIVEVNRDATRKRLFGSNGERYYNCGKESLHKKEVLVTEACHAEITAALKAGFDVVVSDTNLPVKRCRELRALATAVGAETHFEDFSDVPLETCLERNASRTDKDPVPPDVIESMYSRYVRGGLAPVPDEETQDFSAMIPQGHQGMRKSAYIFDIDGTLAHIPEGGRSPYDYSRVLEDTEDGSVLDVMWGLAKLHTIFVVSGRKDECRRDTVEWLDSVGAKYDQLLMRSSDDKRPDWKIKYDLFDKHIRPEYFVAGVFEDRVQVLRMWEQIRLKTFRVGGLNGGNF